MSTRAHVLLAVVAVVVTTAVVAGIVLRSPAPEDDGPVGYQPRELGKLDTRRITVPRGPLCEDVPEKGIRRALGRKPVKARAYGNGDLTRLTPDVRDIAHEFGCAWRTPKVTAQTWVFAPPVPRARARQLAEMATGRKGCSRIDGAPAFGRPSSAVICGHKKELRASYQGLFGDAWLTCELTSRKGRLDRTQLVKRTGRWCAAVLAAGRD